MVAPLAGAWIETQVGDEVGKSKTVAPLAGAWIETASSAVAMACFGSRPSRARGLKPGLRWLTCP